MGRILEYWNGIIGKNLGIISSSLAWMKIGVDEGVNSCDHHENTCDK